MDFNKRQITLSFDGTLAPDHSVSLRTLSYTIPHFQRAVDKTVYFLNFGELRKFSSLPKELHADADLYLHELEEGSLRIPFLSDLVREVPTLFSEFLRQPYEEAAQEVLIPGTAIKNDLEHNKLNAKMGALDAKTQEDFLNRKDEQKRAFARASIIKDISQSLSVVRSTEGGLLLLDVDSDKGMTSFEFNQLRASRFSRLATTKRLEDAALYTGRITGLEKQSGTSSFTYAAKFFSNITRLESKLLIDNHDDALKLSKYNLINKDIKIWAAPVSTYGSFDPMRGDIVFIDVVDEQ